MSLSENRRPLFRDMRWQIVKHRADSSAREGGFRIFELEQAPPDLIDIHSPP
jgi:hypothetical protein